MRRRRIALVTGVVAAGVVVAALTAFVVGGRDGQQPERPADAAAVCRTVVRVRDAVARNRPSKEVFGLVDEAEARARATAAADVRWVPLLSGVQSLEAALEADDGAAANQAMRILRANCTLAAAPID